MCVRAVGSVKNRRSSCVCKYKDFQLVYKTPSPTPYPKEAPVSRHPASAIGPRPCPMRDSWFRLDDVADVSKDDGGGRRARDMAQWAE